jgi:GntR family transcriptional repressor for pyruvate dehydrogenase complex
MNFNHVKPQKGSEIVMNAILQRITSNELQPGSKLPSVVDLAASFDVGRSTIREALSALKAMGLIEIRHGGGTFVSKELPTSPPNAPHHLFEATESLQEVLEVRRSIEAGCVALAAKRRNEEDLIAFESIISNMKDILSDEQKGEQADVDFHLQIAKASHNKLFVQMMESITQRMQESMGQSRALWFYGELASAERLLQEHTDIYFAIKNQDIALAEKLMHLHLHKVDAVLQQFL